MAVNSLVASALIESVINVNSTWAQDVSEMGLLAAFDWDLNLEGSTYTGYLADELDISEAEAVEALTEFVSERRLWTPDNLINNMPSALRIAIDWTDPEMTVEAIVDYASRYESPAVVDALRAAIVGHEYEEELTDALAE